MMKLIAIAFIASAGLESSLYVVRTGHANRST